MSDIHGNWVALDAVLDDVRTHPVDGWICLGDAVQGGPQPCEVVQRLQDLACPLALGNAAWQGFARRWMSVIPELSLAA
jgi:hypothetical protein